VNGSRVTIRENLTQSITINDQQALNSRATGQVYIGRTVTAYGYWQNGTFYATRLN